MEETSPKRTQKTLKSYATKVFQDSSVGVVSSLAHTKSRKRRVYKVIAFFLCLAGFLYQSGTFLEMVLQYPTTVGIEIQRPEMLKVPGFTFCDNNGVNRRIFCEKFSEKCEEPTESFCQKYVDYCNGNKTLVPKREYYSFHDLKTLEEMIEFNDKMEDFVKVETNYYSIVENVTGPYRRLRDEFESSSMCYSLYDRVNSSLQGPQVKKDPIVRRPVIKFRFRVAEDETFLPGSQPGVLLAVHSPYEAVNPFDVGIFMRPGRSYKISVSIEEEKMLQKPYDTNCINYTRMWEKNNRMGPRQQETCTRMCLTDLTLRCFNCVFPMFMLERNESYCDRADFQKSEDCSKEAFTAAVDRCLEDCGDDCMRTKFSHTVQERFGAYFTSTGDRIRDLDNTIEAEIFIEGDEIVVFKYSPKYMFVEVFSNIGGFIGCWLGINLLDITDIVDGFFRITVYSLFSLKRR